MNLDRWLLTYLLTYLLSHSRGTPMAGTGAADLPERCRAQRGNAAELFAWLGLAARPDVIRGGHNDAGRALHALLARLALTVPTHGPVATKKSAKTRLRTSVFFVLSEDETHFASYD